MFGMQLGGLNLGSVKEMQGAIEEKDKKIAEYEQLLSELARIKEEGKGYFAEMTASRAEMDRSLTKVVDHVHEGGELANTGNRDAADLEKELSVLAEQAGTVKESQEQFRSLMEETKEELTAVVEGNKYFTTPAKELQSGAAGLKADVEALKAQTEEFASFFRDMTVTALTAAIDAGRLGESAAKFVQIVEDIRIASEKNEKKLQGYLDQIAQMSARVGEFDQNVEKMNLLQKDSNLASYQALTHHEERMKRSAGSAVDPEALKDLSGRAEELKKSQTKIFEKQNAILDEMEQLGKNFMEERSSSEKAEEEFLQVIGTISFSACRQTQADGAEPTIQGEEE